MPFRIGKRGQLSPPTLYTTVEDALAAGKETWPTDVFHVEQVREAKLSDFFTLSDLVSSLRERMAFLSGDDSVMDSRIVKEGMLPNEGDKVFDDPILGEAIRDTLDAFAEYSHLDLSSLLIVEDRREIRPAP